MAAFTRLEPAQALARSSATSSAGAPYDRDVEQLGRAFAVSGDLLGHLLAEASSSAPQKASSADPGSAMGVFPALAVGQREKTQIVGENMSPVNGERVEAADSMAGAAPAKASAA